MALTTGPMTTIGPQRYLSPHYTQMPALEDPKERKEADGDGHKVVGGTVQSTITEDGAVGVMEAVTVTAMAMEDTEVAVMEADMVEVTGAADMEEVTMGVMVKKEREVTEVGEDGSHGLNILTTLNKSSTIIHQ